MIGLLKSACMPWLRDGDEETYRHGASVLLFGGRRRSPLELGLPNLAQSRCMRMEDQLRRELCVIGADSGVSGSLRLILWMCL